MELDDDGATKPNIIHTVVTEEGTEISANQGRNGSTESARSSADAMRQSRAAKRGDVMKGIFREPIGVVAKVYSGFMESNKKLRPSEELQAHSGTPSGGANSPSDALASSSATLPHADDLFLQALPLPRNSEARATLWTRIDANMALEHQGSVLYKDDEGKWVVE